MFHVKICGITEIGDATMAADAGADAIGLNFYPNSPRCVSVQQAGWLSREVRESSAVQHKVTRVGVFVNADESHIREVADQVELDAVQLHGDEPSDLVSALAPIPVIRAVRFRGEDGDDFRRAVDECRAGLLAAVLLDAWSAQEYGGSGKALGWSSLSEIGEHFGSVPWILAGGLNPGNVSMAIERARPFGVDVASGVEAQPGTKIHDKVIQFCKRARAALAGESGNLG